MCIISDDLSMKRNLLFLLLCCACAAGAAFASPLYSPTWGFRLDPPEDYEFVGGDGKDRFSFRNADGAGLDLVVYGPSAGKQNPYTSAEALAQDVSRRLGNAGDISLFEYRHKQAALLELSFSNSSGQNSAQMSGWGLAVELGVPPQSRGNTGKPLLLVLAYGPAEKPERQSLHFSALDSIAPAEEDRLAPGPVTTFSYPQVNRKKAAIAGINAEAWFFDEDAEAAQTVVDREFAVLRRFAGSKQWKEAWSRFYRAIYRDSFDRLSNAAFVLERQWNTPPIPGGKPENPAVQPAAIRDNSNREFAGRVLEWTQSFKYERDLLGSDFVNLVSAAVDGRGDCDSRAMLFAVVLNQADIPAAIMVSRNYSHAMGLADIQGSGARFEADKKKWLVAETTAPVPIGLIGKEVSEIEHWLGITFE
jgi:hypothetical protein